MSGLAALLAGAREPGVYRCRARIEVVREAVAPSRWSLAHVDGWTTPTRADTLAALVRALDLPGGAATNLDALWDGRRDLLVPVVVLWPGWSVLAHADPAGLGGLLRVLAERAAEERDLTVLLQGDGPDLAPPPPLLD